MDAIDKILNLMDNLNISAYQLSKKTGISNNLVSQWKQHKQNPSIKSLSKIAKFFDVPVEYFLTNELDNYVKPVGRLGLDFVYDLMDDDVEGKLFTDAQKDCVKKLIRINKAGQDKVIDYVNDLYGNPDYRVDKNKAEK